MSQLVFYFLFWIFYAGLSIAGNTKVCVTTTFSKPHVENAVKAEPKVRFIAADVMNPIFVLK